MCCMSHVCFLEVASSGIVEFRRAGGCLTPFSKVTGRQVEELPHVLQVLDSVEGAFQLHGLLEMAGPAGRVVDSVTQLNLRLVNSVWPAVDLDQSFVMLSCRHSATDPAVVDSVPQYRCAAVQLSVVRYSGEHVDAVPLTEDAMFADHDALYSWWQDVKLETVWVFARSGRAGEYSMYMYKLLGHHENSRDGQSIFNLTAPYVETHSLTHWNGHNIKGIIALLEHG